VTQLPSPQRRHPAPQHARRLRPKTYSVAVYLVGAVVLLQIVMLISVFWLRAMVVSVDVKVPKALMGSLPATNAPPMVGPVTPLKPATPAELPSLPSLATTSPHPALLSVPTESDELEQVGELNDQAEVSLRDNNPHTALTPLVKAEDIDPSNPTTLKNLAQAYYLMNDPVRSKFYWQRLVDLGPGVGTIYGVAKDHIVLLGAKIADVLKMASDYRRAIYINEVEKTPVETIEGQPQFHLRTVLMRKSAKGPFEQKKLQPYVIFYQQMPDGSLVPDLNQHKGAFDDTFLFWGNKAQEPFGVDYIMPLPGSPGPNGTTNGKYYGFVIGIYYDKMLQDARSEPSDLITRMPLPDAIE
jgi:hypothetical protein